MSLKKTLIMFVVFAAVLGAYIWSTRQQAEEARQEEISSRLVTPEASDITRITIRREGETLELSRQDELWRLEEPVAARADQSAVQSLLSTIDTTKKTDPFDATELGDFGLQEPAITAEIRASGNYAQTLYVGGDTPAGDEVYVRLEDGNQVFTAPTALRTTLTKSPAELRDKRTVPAHVSNATTLTLTGEQGGEFELQKREGQWMLTEPTTGAADEEAVSAILSAWNNAQAADWIGTQTQSLSDYGLASPAWRGTVYVAGRDPRTSPTEMTLLIGSEAPDHAGRRWATMAGDPTIFTVESSLVDTLTPTLDELRSKALLTIPAQEIGTAVFNVRGTSLSLERDSAGQWRFAGEPEVRLDQALVSSKISQLASLKATRFITGETSPTVTGLDDPNLRVSVVSEAGTSQTLITGRKDDTEDIVYARRTDTGETFAIDWQEPGKFFLLRDELIDKRIFDFSAELIGQVEITEGTRTLELTRQASGGWVAQGRGGQGSEQQVEASTMMNLLYAIIGLNWKRSLDPALPDDQELVQLHNLNDPPQELVFMDDQGDEVARLGIGGEDDRNVYLTRNGQRHFAVDKANMSIVVQSLREVLNQAGGE